METWQTAKEVHSIWRAVKDSIQNLTRVWKVDLKCVVKILFQNLTRQKIFSSNLTSQKKCIQNQAFYRKFFNQNHALWKTIYIQNHAFKKNFSSKSCFSKMHVNCKVCAIYGVNWNKTWLFACKIFFRIRFIKLCFSSESCCSKLIFSFNIILFQKLFFLTIWRVVKFLIQNLTPWRNIYLSTDAL